MGNILNEKKNEAHNKYPHPPKEKKEKIRLKKTKIK